MEIATAYKSDRTVAGNYKDIDTAISALEAKGFELVSRGSRSATMERHAGKSAFSHLLKPEYGPYDTPAETVTIEVSRVSGL